MYAPVGCNGSADKKKERDEEAREVSELVRSKLEGWRRADKDICSIVMGDFQETITSTALDNWGNYVRNPSPGDLVSWLLKSHHSVVHTSNPHEQYITRWGRKGERGIDHIFYPRRDELKAWVEEAIIEQQLSRLHFPSNHALLRLIIRRWIPDEDR